MKARVRVGVIGAGGHGRVVREVVALQPHLEVCGFFDDDPRAQGRVIDGTPVLGPVDLLRQPLRPVEAVVVAIGIDNWRRGELFLEMSALAYEMVSAIHPFSAVSPFATIGRGLIAMAGAIVNPGAEIGEDVCVNTGASVDHDCRLADHCSVMPNASLAGGVSIGAYACVFQNASINQYLSVGAGAIVGAGAVVTRDIPDRVVAVGVPARVISAVTRGNGDGEGSSGDAGVAPGPEQT